MRNAAIPVTGRSRSIGASSSIIVPTLLRKPFTAYGVVGRVRQLGGLVVHHLGAVAGEFDHLGRGDAIDRVRVGDAARIGGEHAADVGEDVDRGGIERVAQRDRGQVAAAAAERRDAAAARRALKAGDDRNDTGGERRLDGARDRR